MSLRLPTRSVVPGPLLLPGGAAGPARWCLPGSVLPLPCGPHHVLVFKVGQATGGKSVQIAAPSCQRGDPAEGGVDGVLLGGGAQRLLGGGKVLVVDFDERLGHGQSPPSPDNISHRDPSGYIRAMVVPNPERSFMSCQMSVSRASHGARSAAVSEHDGLHRTSRTAH